MRGRILPYFGNRDSDNLIEIYVVTGWHGIIKIPDNFCKECHIMHNRVLSIVEENNIDADIRVKSYWFRFLRPLMKGGYHPPVLIVNGELVCQGYEMPVEEDITDKIKN